ncbi:MAG: NTP transferase domain-containing protein, partial [Bacteroidota bacterium]
MGLGLLLLAAGRSRRLGQPKQLLPFRGDILLNHALRLCLAVPTVTTRLVLGANTPAIRPKLAGGNYQLVVNEDWELGLGKSIAAGMAANDTSNWKGVIICLGDQPFLTSAILKTLYQQ